MFTYSDDQALFQRRFCCQQTIPEETEQAERLTAAGVAGAITAEGRLLGVHVGFLGCGGEKRGCRIRGLDEVLLMISRGSLGCREV